MAKLSISYDVDELKVEFENDTAQLNFLLIEKLHKIIEEISVRIANSDPVLIDTIDRTLCQHSLDYLNMSKTYSVNKKILESPIPIINPILSFSNFIKRN